MNRTLRNAGVVAVFAACSPKEEITPQIAVTPGAASRINLMPSKQARAESKPVRVTKMEAGHELLGPNAIGKAGDWVIENDEVVFVIDQLGSSAGFAESGGNVVDAADARTREDELGQMFTDFGTFPRQGVYQSLRPFKNDDGSAGIRVSGYELYEGALKVETTYTLRPNDRALLLETTLQNGGPTEITGIALGDAVQWGGAEKFAPGKSLGFRGPSKGPYVGGVGRRASYALAPTEGEFDAVSGGSWTDTKAKEVSIQPGASVSFARVLLVGPRPDTAGIVSELAKMSGSAVGVVRISLADAAGKPVAPEAGMKAIVSSESGAPLMSLVATAKGFEGEVPPGKYTLTYSSSAGRRGIGGPVAVHVASEREAHAVLSVSDAARIFGQCEDTAGAIPCKVTIEGEEGTKTPDFGSAHVAGGAKNKITTHDGAFDVAVAPGKYRVTLSHGPETALVTYIETATAHQRVGRTSKLTRVVDTAGYVSTDFHQHTMLGADAPVSTRDRVISNAAENVEVAVSTEHNVVVDLQPIVEELGLQKVLVHLPGDEITTDANRHPWGHANIIPLDVDSAKARGGAPSVSGKTAHELFEEVRKIQEPHILQVNHPRAGITGYFDQMGFDSKTGVGLKVGYDPGFDAIEVWNGRDPNARERVFADYLALLRTSHPVTPTADTDTHGIVGQEPGLPRTYVRVEKDDSLDKWDEARTADLVKGVNLRRDVVLTNGPFLRVSANGAPIGGIAKPKAKKVSVVVHVECAPWVEVKTIKVVRASLPEAPIVKALAMKANASGAVIADVTLSLDSKGDDAFVVVVEGDKPMTPVFDGDAKEIAPFAMSGAIWIDADGDGVSLGRK